jgi:hypothetical protein
MSYLSEDDIKRANNLSTQETWTRTPGGLLFAPGFETDAAEHTIGVIKQTANLVELLAGEAFRNLLQNVSPIGMNHTAHLLWAVTLVTPGGNMLHYAHAGTFASVVSEIAANPGFRQAFKDGHLLVDVALSLNTHKTPEAQSHQDMALSYWQSASHEDQTRMIECQLHLFAAEQETAAQNVATMKRQTEGLILSANDLKDSVILTLDNQTDLDVGIQGNYDAVESLPADPRPDPSVRPTEHRQRFRVVQTDT